MRARTAATVVRRARGCKREAGRDRTTARSAGESCGNGSGRLRAAHRSSGAAAAKLGGWPEWGKSLRPLARTTRSRRSMPFQDVIQVPPPKPGDPAPVKVFVDGKPLTSPQAVYEGMVHQRDELGNQMERLK